MTEYSDAGLESLLSRAIDRSVPDLRDSLSGVDVVPLINPDGIVPLQEMPARHTLRRAVAGAAACLMLAVGLGAFSFLHADAYIGIYVNPSFQLTANRYDRVLSVEALNPDAEEVLDGMDLNYLELDTAVNALVGSMAVHGYFNPGEEVAVTVSVSGGSEERNHSLQERLATDIKTAAATVGASAQVHAPQSETATPDDDDRDDDDYDDDRDDEDDHDDDDEDDHDDDRDNDREDDDDD